jgi:tRNA dimethylallyltransferase
LNKSLIVICGPTASGKSQLAIALAKHYNTEIISADSRQVYKEMKIGTARLSIPEMQGVKHHFTGFLSVTQEYNAGKFEQDALSCVDKIFEKNNIAILCGGTGLYIDAVCKGLDNLPSADKKIREKLEADFRNIGIDSLQNRLKILDPEFYEQVDKKNPHRLIRAIEVCLLAGKKYSELRKSKNANRPFSVCKIGINIPKDKLHENIDSRVEEMYADGLVEEVKALMNYKNLPSLNTVGYSEFINYFENKTPIETVLSEIKQNTKKYAKRQMTWFRKDKSVCWIDKPDVKKAVEIFERNNSDLRIQ